MRNMRKKCINCDYLTKPEARNDTDTCSCKVRTLVTLGRTIPKVTLLLQLTTLTRDILSNGYTILQNLNLSDVNCNVCTYIHN